MSFKYHAKKITNNHYVLPKMADMKCDAHAFLSEDLYNQTEEEMWTQIVNSASYEGVIGAYLVPDCHLGYGIPVGGIVVTEDTIIQSGSGFDINCGVLYLKAKNLTAENVKDWDKRVSWIKEVEKRISVGVGSNRPELMKKFSIKDLESILRFGAKAIDVNANLCERQYIDVGDDFDSSKILKAYDKALAQIGSVGGGNHFIEMQVDKDDGSVWVMVHCGSRGYGWQTANHFFHEGAALRGIPDKKRESSWLRADEKLGKEYWQYHNSAANYAIANRHVIADAIKDATTEIFNADLDVYYEISHNLVQKETLVLPDGSTKKGFVHRKGATRAFPAGHPDLVNTVWEKTGHPCLIPGSAYDGAAILFAKDSQKSGYSVNHGSGRILGRAKAKKQLAEEQNEIDLKMKDVTRVLGGVPITGIAGNYDKTPLDECHKVYKNLDAVLNILKEENIAEVKHRMYPVANLKGLD